MFVMTTDVNSTIRHLVDQSRIINNYRIVYMHTHMKGPDLEVYKHHFGHFEIFNI